MESSVTPILVLRKAWRILDVFSPDRPELDFQQIRTATGLPATTCLRLVRNLVQEGVLTHAGDRYRVGLAPVRWAAAARAGLRMVDLLMPYLERLRDETGETAALFVRQGSTRVCAALAETTHSVVRRLWVGHAIPLYLGSPGKVLLAFADDADAVLRGKLTAATPRTITDAGKLREALEQIRAAGYATSFGEWDIDVAGIAAPVFGSGGRIAAAVGISAPAQRLGPEQAKRYAPLIVQAARDASAQLALLPAA